MDDDYIWANLDVQLGQLGADLAMDKSPDGSARVALTAQVPSLDGGTRLRLIQAFRPTMKEAAGAAVRELRELMAVMLAAVAARAAVWTAPAPVTA